MSNRILDYPEATAITSDDYILLDNAGTGAKCIKASALNVNMDNYTIKEARGSIASFDDGEDLPLAFMGAYITAIQDLHGYEYPWVGGAGKNKIDAKITASVTIKGITSEIKADNNLVASGESSGNGDINVVFNNTVSLKANTTYTLSINGTDTRTGALYVFALPDYSRFSVTAFDFNTHSITFTMSEDKDITGLMLRTTSGNTVNINAKLQLEVGSSATSFQPYSNECPIIGWSAVDVTRCGKNFYNATLADYSSTQVVGVGLATFYPIKVPYGTYTISTNAPTGYIWAGTNIYDSSTLPRVYDGNPNTVTTDVIWVGLLTSDMSSAYAYNIMINQGSTPIAYEPYNGNTYSLTFTDGSNPLTVYYGTVDLISGLLTVTYGRDLGSSLNWGDYGSNNTYYAEISSKKAGFENLLMSDYSYFSGTYANMPNGTFKGSGNTKYIYIRDDRYSSATEFKNNITTSIVYELATPLTYQLSKQQIRSLVGENNIFADTGDSIVDYRKLWVKPEM